MGVPRGSGDHTGTNLPESFYSELQSADWVDGPSQVPDHIAPNEHLAVIYEDGEEPEFTLRFLRDGIEREQHCLYVSTGSVPAELTTEEFDFPNADTAAYLHVYDLRELGPDDEPQSADELFAEFQRTIAAHAETGEQSRIVVEMDGLLEAVPFQDLLEYEARLNRVARKNDVVILCQCRRNRHHAERISDLLETYPYIVVDGTVCYNTEYLPPSAFLSQKRADHEVQQTIETLRQQTQAQLALDRERQRNEKLKVFANSIAHDLRNPLQTAIGRTELLPEHEEQVEVVADALDRMEQLIDDGLDMVFGDEIAESEPVSVGTLANQCWTMIDVADAKLTVTEDFQVIGDKARIQQLFENLFRNSIEYGGPSPTIRVGPIERIHLTTRAGSDPGYTGFYVEDDGPGVPTDQREEIFEIGVSGGNGTGYGLAIVQEIVDAHGWQIHVTAGSGGGARFEITGIDASPPK